jgi:hypothetical protein
MPVENHAQETVFAYYGLSKEAAYGLKDLLKVQRMADQPGPHLPYLPKHLHHLASQPEVARRWLAEQERHVPKTIAPKRPASVSKHAFTLTPNL